MAPQTSRTNLGSGLPAVKLLQDKLRKLLQKLEAPGLSFPGNEKLPVIVACYDKSLATNFSLSNGIPLINLQFEDIHAMQNN